jgi:hypothetical protein
VIEIFGEGTSVWFTYQNSGDDFIFIERLVQSFYSIVYNKDSDKIKEYHIDTVQRKHKILQYI